LRRILILSGSIFSTTAIITAANQRPTPSSLNHFDLIIILSNFIFVFTYFRAQAAEVFPVAIKDIFQNMQDAVFVLDPEFNIIQYNSSAETIFRSIQSGDEISKYINTIGSKLKHIQKAETDFSEIEINLKGMIYRARFDPIHFEGQLIGWILNLADITKHKHAEEQLAHNALHDRLTDLPNRVILMDRLDHAMLTARRDEDYKYAVLVLDLDRFKVINDNLGHQTGDQVLVEIAQRLKKCLRKVDTAARLGGDEFVILLDNVSGIRAASEVALRVLDLLSKKMIISDQEIYPSVSIGISMGSQRHQKADDILSEADIALQQSKQRGKGQFAIFDKEMHAHVSTLFQLEKDLRHALQKDQFENYYQPILSLSRRAIRGFEVLLRWNHPKHGLMQPGEFLHETDEPELILPIGYWSIQKACYDLARWSSEFSFDPALTLNINLFQKQLFDPELPEILKAILQETKLLPDCLTLEIKERMIVDDREEILAAIEKVKSIGIGIALDDFGTGYSSLRVLPTYPIDQIKIAPSYIRNICRSTEDFEVVRFIVGLCQKLGKGVIAQGIKSPHELIELQSIQCTRGQGSYFSDPLNSDAIDQLLTKVSKMEPSQQQIDRKKLI
jgi:diguanylate cyclase (GGDEF)-like protein